MKVCLKLQNTITYKFMENKALLIFTILLSPFFSIVAFSQNLIVNPSFETYLVCPSFPVGINSNGVTNWTQPSMASSDLFHSCSAFPILDVPDNTISVGYQFPLTGLGYGGMIAWAPDPSTAPIEFLQNQLSSPLVSGETYIVSINISLADNCDHYLGKLGVYFSRIPYILTMLLSATL